MTNFLLTSDASNTYIQSGASATPGSTAPIIFTGMGGTPELMRITADGKLVIGGITPDGSILQVATAALTVDQSQTVSSSFTSAVDNYQTFTAGITGTLSRVDIYVASTFTGTLEIRQGTGLSGALLSSLAVTIFSSMAQSIDIPWCSLASGSVYTIALRGTSEWRGSATDVYAGGSCAFGGGDRYFVTYMRSTSPTNVLSVTSSVMTFNGTTTQNNLNTQYIHQDLVDDASVSIHVTASGWGFLQVGNNTAYSRFLFNINDILTLGVYQSANVVYNATTDSNFCITCDGTNVTLQNRLGSTATVRGELNW